MNKGELIAEVAKLSQRTQRDTKRTLDAFFSIIVETLKKGEEVDIEYFGKFTAKEVGEKRVTSYITKEQKILPPHKRFSFEYSRDMKLIIKYNL